MLEKLKGSDQIFIRWLQGDFLVIGLYTLGLGICVCLSHYFSRFMPVDVFATILTPTYHFTVLVIATVGAVLVHLNQKGIRARGAWRVALVLLALQEAGLLIAQYVFKYPTLVYEIHEIRVIDLVMSDVFAIILLAYPAEVLCPRWLTPVRGSILFAIPFAIWGLDFATAIDLRAVMISYPLLISLWLVGKIPAYEQKCEENFSSLENSAMRWIWIYMITLIVIGISFFYVCFTHNPTRLFTQQWLILFLLLYNTGQILLRPRPWQEEVAEDEEETERDAFPAEYRTAFENWMKQEKPYTNPEFRLLDLMHVLPLNRTYLSRFIKSEYNCNFYQLVTTYRVDEAKRLLIEQPQMKIWEVAESAGFTSAIVFNRAFKRETDMTPTEWLETANTDKQ